MPPVRDSHKIQLISHSSLKNEIEKSLQEILFTGIIQYSTDSFSSPLVKTKKMEVGTSASIVEP